jgi:chemotaxis protein methyltransferase CheR
MPLGSFDLTHVAFEGRPLPPARRPSAPRPVVATPLHAPRLHPRPSRNEITNGFAVWVLERAGVDASLYRGSALNRRVPACLRALKVTTPEAGRDLVERRPSMLSAALNALLIGVTGFFRDPWVFAALERHVVPELARRPGGLRIWSAGCSTGEELYSVAILLAEAGLLDRSLLLGTDCRADAVAAGRAGRYPKAALAPVPAACQARSFDGAGAERRVVAAIRERTSWVVRSLSLPAPSGEWDLVLWRNAAIYLTPPAAASTCTRLADAVGLGGFLVLGRAERPPGDAPLSAVARCIYRKGTQST